MDLDRSVVQSVSIYINLQVALINNLFSDLDTVSLLFVNHHKSIYHRRFKLTGLTYGTLTEQPNFKVPTVSDNLTPGQNLV